MRLRYLAAAPLVAVAMFGTTAAAWARPGTAAIPQAPPALTASALSARYAADGQAIAGPNALAARDGDASWKWRAGPPAHPARAVLQSERSGGGRDGDLRPGHGDAGAILVPGSDTTLATFFSGTGVPGGGAEALAAGRAPARPGERLAIIAWLGYPPRPCSARPS
jgi:hypothetical protein